MSHSLKIVVLGGTGFVGRTLVHALQAAGHRVDVLSRNRERLRHLLVYPTVRVISTSVYDQAALTQRLRGADAVINLVGVLQSAGFGGADFERAHVTLTRTLIAAMRAAGVQRLLQMSSLRAGEGDSHYLRTRGEAEALVQNSGLAWTLFQPSVIFGPGDGLFCRFAPLLKWFWLIPLARAGARFQPVYVKDVAEAMLRTLSRADSIGQRYPLVGPKTYTLAEIVRYTAELLDVRRLILPLPAPLGRLQAFACDLLPAALKPFSGDNYKSLAVDSVSARNGLTELGIVPMPLEMVVPDYLGQSDHQRELDAFRAR
ncbi:MAG: complex I NDUFA9 subunit family protein [Lysobacterales bacterium]